MILIPVVNVYGFNSKVRYLPDRRDLNRCFPGSPNGPLGMQIAHIFMTEIVHHCTHGIDLHTGAIHRSNLSQIRTQIDNEETSRLAHAFGVPVVLNSNTRDGSLRQACAEQGVQILLFEGGEALRYDEKIIKSAVRGVQSVMAAIGMVDSVKVSNKSRKKEVFVAHSSHWIRAPDSGSLRIRKQLGSHVKKNELLGVISDPFGGHKREVRAKSTGVVIGMTMIPLVNRGDAIFHIATFEDSIAVKEQIDVFGEAFD